MLTLTAAKATAAEAEGRIFSWKAAGSASSHRLTPRGQASLDGSGAMRVGGGAFTVRGADQALLAACKASNELTIEGVFQADRADQRGPARIITFSRDTGRRNFTLGQETDRLVLRLRTPRTGPNGTTPQLTLCRIPMLTASHIVVTYRQGVTTCFVNGVVALTSRRVSGDFSNWEPCHLLFGDEWSGERNWAGSLAAVAIYSRALTSAEVAHRFHTSGVEEASTRARKAQTVKIANLKTVHGVHGPLRVHPTNPRYFTDDSGRAILLTGSHTWNSLVDIGLDDPPPAFDFDKYLAWMTGYGHNFMRLWTWEGTSWGISRAGKAKPRRFYARPQPWPRTGPGEALDGKPKFDLTKLNDAYFTRLRDRVSAARDRGIYTAVMLFEGWGSQFATDAWTHNPFHPDNNVNGINGDLNRDGKGLEIHSGRSAQVTDLQRAYVRRVVDTVNEFDNVLYEISNENHPESTQWQYGMIKFIKDYEQRKPKQRPVGMTFQYKGGRNRTLFDSPADWISPNPRGGYRDNPPAANGSKVIINDTDHLWGIGGNAGWVWKSFLRGMNPIFMDPYDGVVTTRGAGSKWAEAIRKAMGYALTWSQRVDLAAMVPHGDLASSGYCLAHHGVEYLVYLPAGTKSVKVTLPAGSFAPTWLDPGTGREIRQDRFRHTGGERTLTSPSQGDALLYLTHTR